ncbi:hypothetical protein M670_04008 [Schinkia azotoformans MEV2011]|uniref:Uncharacterized protein n=1 Tax=Schinkia azotoformans MEV2011 TaxID=1348973 RepID=A0A072NHM7_SCHAZ|nr:hypothetical protein [Schinkia azotoformans]KEF36757.1 hypothetical protein M670_04008 [Schinkia azotoformans MEV2011]MEC1698219.1 hypothetical protein [Schinkia azotoformans]MEC1727573.1 hypothetical protein [Schinkia azotoformans]MEC1773098.1 hypothetical protein [Schinkia azotoformans]MEC1777908.1 hypothetical protein [Schinkia azotoformans]
MNRNAFEKLMWSIALPGFGQFLNGKIVKGIVLVALEFLINVKANFNKIILLSFNGKINEAVHETDLEWLMFYPCLYFFAMWDAVKDAGGGKDHFSFLPYVFSAFFVTVGLMYSSNLKIFGIFFGPVWLPMLFVIPGVITGLITKKIMNIIY